MTSSIQMLRYPFSLDARKQAQRLARDLNDLVTLLEDQANEYIIEAAEERVIDAVEQNKIKVVNTRNELDVLIYPTARIIVEYIGDTRIRSLQAEAESKSVNKSLGGESDAFVKELCESSLDWSVDAISTPRERMRLPVELRGFDFKIRYEDFLEAAPHFHQTHWKLVNRYVDSGWVYIQRSELDRLVSEMFKQFILGVEMTVPQNLPKRLVEAIQRVESITKTKTSGSGSWSPIAGDVGSAYPPCIMQIKSDLEAGKNLPHTARFAIAAFWTKIGLDNDEVKKRFRASPDAGVRGGRILDYQVEHVAGLKSGPEYTPPGCKKMQSNSLCPVYLGTAWDPLCEYVLHPLAFYQTRAWEVSKGVRDHSWYQRKRKKKQFLR